MLGRASVARQTGTLSIGLGVLYKACRQRRCVTHTVSPLTATTHLGMLPSAPGSGFGYLTHTPISEPGCDQRWSMEPRRKERATLRTSGPIESQKYLEELHWARIHNRGESDPSSRSWWPSAGTGDAVRGSRRGGPSVESAADRPGTRSV